MVGYKPHRFGTAFSKIQVGRGNVRYHGIRNGVNTHFFTDETCVRYAIAAQLSFPSRRVICLQGDSAFGFSGMEMETMVRYNLPILIVVMNNNGVYHGLTTESFEKYHPAKLPSTALTPNIRYDEMMNAVGGRGYVVRTKEELEATVKVCLETSIGGPKLINVLIDPVAERGKVRLFPMRLDYAVDNT